MLLFTLLLLKTNEFRTRFEFLFEKLELIISDKFPPFDLLFSLVLLAVVIPPLLFFLFCGKIYALRWY